MNLPSDPPLLEALSRVVLLKDREVFRRCSLTVDFHATMASPLSILWARPLLSPFLALWLGDEQLCSTKHAHHDASL